MCEELDDGAVDEFDLSFGDFAVDQLIEWFGCEEGAEVGVHSFGLVEGSGEDSDFDAWLEDEVEECGDGGVEGFASASVGPDDAVSWLTVFEEGVGEVFEWGVVAFDEGGGWDSDVEVGVDPLGELLVGLWR